MQNLVIFVGVSYCAVFSPLVVQLFVFSSRNFFNQSQMHTALGKISASFLHCEKRSYLQRSLYMYSICEYFFLVALPSEINENRLERF